MRSGSSEEVVISSDNQRSA